MLRGFLCAAVLMAASLPAAAQTAVEAKRFTADELRARVAGTQDGLAASTLPTGPNTVAIAVRRERSGDVEVHRAHDDILVVRSGRVSILTGHEVSGGRETAPGERRGGAIAKPDTIQLRAGDMLWVPAGLAHQMILRPGEKIDYLALKFPAEPQR